MKKILLEKKYILIALGGVVAVALLFVGGNILSDKIAENREVELEEKYASDAEKKQFIEAIRNNEKDLASNPSQPKEIAATMDIGLQWFNLQENEAAVRWWKKGLDIQPKNTIGWYNLGNAYRELKQYGNAENAYLEAIATESPSDNMGCLALGELYQYNYQEKKDQIDDVYIKCLKKHPKDRDILARLATYYKDMGDKKNALIRFDELYSIDPSPEVGEEIRKLQRQ